MQRAFRTPISYFGGLLLLSLWLHSIFFFCFVIFYFYNNNRLYSSLLIVNVVALLIDQYVVNERQQLRIVTRSVFNDSSRTFVFLAHQQCFIGHSCCTTRLMVFIFLNVIVIALKAKTESMPFWLFSHFLLSLTRKIQEMFWNCEWNLLSLLEVSIQYTTRSA